MEKKKHYYKKLFRYGRPTEEVSFKPMKSYWGYFFVDDIEEPKRSWTKIKFIFEKEKYPNPEDIPKSVKIRLISRFEKKLTKLKKEGSNSSQP